MKVIRKSVCGTILFYPDCIVAQLFVELLERKTFTKTHIRKIQEMGYEIKITKTHIAVKIAVFESEAGDGKKIDDWMVCLSYKDAKEFAKEFNSKNKQPSAPNWYMQAEGETQSIELNEAQFLELKKKKRVWLSVLNAI